MSRLDELELQMEVLWKMSNRIEENIAALNRIITELYIEKSGGIPDTLGDSHGSD